MAGNSNLPAEHFTDLGNARRLVNLHVDDLRYVHAQKAWYVWNELENYWQRDRNGEIGRRAVATIEHLMREAMALDFSPERTALIQWALSMEALKQINAMITLAQDDARIVAAHDLFDADPLLLGVRNGVIDLRTNEFRNGRREDYISQRCNVVYDPLAQCPRWLEFLEVITAKDRDLIAYKQRVAGVLLAGEAIEILFIAHGTGANGKTTELEMVHEILGDYAYACDASLLVNVKNVNRGAASPEIVALKGKRAVFINETQARDRLNEARVKYLTGSDIMQGRDLWERPINWKPTHKPVLRTNYKPRIADMDEGIWRRLHCIPYLVTFAEENRETDFRERVLLPEKAGIFNYMLAGWAEYRDAGRRLNPPPNVCEEKAAYKRAMDHTGRWIDLCCEYVPGCKTALKVIHAAYAAWFKDEIGDYGTVSSSTLAQRLIERNGAFDKRKGKGGVTIFHHLRLQEPEPDSSLESNPLGEFEAQDCDFDTVFDF